MVDIRGVSYDPINMKLHIKTCRKAEIRADIGSILKADELEPGHAGKLKCKLGLAASQLWGKVGREFFLALSERQHMRYYEPGTHYQLGPALRLAQRQRDKLVEAGPPRMFVPASDAPADLVLFTDGFTPDP